MIRDHQDWPFYPLGSPTSTPTPATTASGDPTSGRSNWPIGRKEPKTLLKRKHRRRHHHHYRLDDGDNQGDPVTLSARQQQEPAHDSRRPYRSIANISSTHLPAASPNTTSRAAESTASGSSPSLPSATMGAARTASRQQMIANASGGNHSSDNADSDLQFRPADILSYSQTLGRQYSSSQAQLQSLTSPNFANGGDTSRKTPIYARSSAGLLQQKQYRSQQMLATSHAAPLPPPQPTTAASTVTTTMVMRPPTMMASALNDSSSLTNLPQQQPQLATAFASTQPSGGQLVRQQQVTFSHALGQRQSQFNHLLAAAAHPVSNDGGLVTCIGTSAHISSGHQLPPPPYSATDAAASLSPHPAPDSSQNMNASSQSNGGGAVPICQQPQGRPSTPFPTGCTNNGGQQAATITSSANSNTRTARAQASSSTSPPPPPPSSSSSIPSQSAASQQIMNYPSINTSQQQYPTLAHYQQHHHHRQADTAAGRCLHQQQQQQQQQPTLVGISKSKSCLACADISIKWYVVVIALLGLICALIGTIVGAVHSAGRDYISLALLLIGVGLVFIAISWVALRITINTYRSSRGRQSASRSQQQAQTGRLFGAAINQSSGSLHRALLNERLYMMAAAAAIMSRQQSCSQGGVQQQDTSQQAPPVATSPSGGIFGSIKRRFARLIPGRRAPEAAEGAQASENATATTTSSGENQSLVSSSWCRRPPGERSQLAAATNSQQQQQQQQQAALAAMFIQQYQQQQQHPCQPPPALLAPGILAPFLFAQPPPPPPQLFGLATGLLGPEYPYRPPPPSYNASVQDQRVRALMQERNGIMQWQANNPIYMPGAHQHEQQHQPQQQQQQQQDAPSQVQPSSQSSHNDSPTQVRSADETPTATSSSSCDVRQQCQPTTIVIGSQSAKEACTALRRTPSIADTDRSRSSRSITNALKPSSSTPAISVEASSTANSSGFTIVDISSGHSATSSGGQTKANRRHRKQGCEVKTLGYL